MVCQKRLQQAKDWWHHEEKSDKKGEPRAGGQPNLARHTVPVGWL